MSGRVAKRGERMRVVLRWSIMIIGSIVAFGLAARLSGLAGASEGWALGIGAIAAGLVLDILQTWANRHRRPR